MFEKWEKICQIVIFKCEISRKYRELTQMVHFFYTVPDVNLRQLRRFHYLALESMGHASISDLLLYDVLLMH